MTLVCAQRHREYYPVGSGSSSRVYPVKMFLPNELPSCTCTGFMTKRNKNANIIGGGYAGAGAGLAKQTAAWCKHLDEVKRTTCDWQGARGERQLQCPQCGGPVVDDATKRLPAGRGPVVPGVGTLPVMTTAATPKKRAARTPKAADPKALIKMMQELAADTTPKASVDPAKARKTFEQITGKAAPDLSDPDVAADELAKLLEKP